MSKINEAVGKVKGFAGEIKTHWKEPAEGKYVPYREYKDIFISVGSNYTASKMLEYIVFAASCYLVMYHYKLPYLTFSVINIINMPLNYVWTLISWYIGDNLGFLPKKTERKLYLLYSFLTIAGIALIVLPFTKLFNPSAAWITYLNGLEGITAASAFKIFGTHILWNGWFGMRNIFWRKKLIPKFGRYKYSLYCDAIPKCVMVVLMGWLPVYNITDVVTRVWVANLLFACYNMFGFQNNIEICTKSISPNTKERILVRTYPVKLSHFVHSIVAILIPVFVGKLRYKWEDINFYRYVIPGVFIAFVALTMIFANRIKERIPQPPIEKKVQIKFWDGMLGVMRNKYLLINNLVTLIDSLGNGMLTLTTILYLYTFRLSGLPYALLIQLISFAGTPPDLFTPYFLKKFSYKQIQVFYQLSRFLGNGAIVLAIWFCGENLMLCGTICVVVMFFLEMTKTVPVSSAHDMDVRIADYQMYLSGERLENVSGIFGWFIGPITTVVGLIIPLFLFRYGFNSNWDILFLDTARRNIVAVPILIDCVGYLLMTIPFLFWDFDDKKHKKVMAVLKKRAEVMEKQAVEEGTVADGSFIG